MKKVRKIAWLLIMVFLFQGCTKKEEKTSETIYPEDSFVLTSVDNTTFVFPNLKEFTWNLEGVKQPTNSIDLHYKELKNSIMSLKILKTKEDYGEAQIKEDLKDYTERYERLTKENDGKMISSIPLKTLEAGEYVIHYTGVSYQLTDCQTSSADFFVITSEYIIYGTLRIEKELWEKEDFEKLFTSMFKNLKVLIED